MPVVVSKMTVINSELCKVAYVYTSYITSREIRMCLHRIKSIERKFFNDCKAHSISNHEIYK